MKARQIENTDLKNTLPLTASQFIQQLQSNRIKKGDENLRFYKGENRSTKSTGNQMGFIFKLAKDCVKMNIAEIEKLLDSDYYEARMGAVSIMDFKARAKKISKEERKKLFDVYLNKHDRIDNWDLVDRSAPHVIGAYLADQPRKILYKLAKSSNIWERRTAIVSTYFFLKQREVKDTFAIAELLVNDKEELINKAVGSWIREAGKQDKTQLLKFLDAHMETMPRVTLRYAIEKLTKKQKAYYMDH